MTPAGRTGTVDAVPTGNTFDKYGSTNPVVRRLMSGFERSLGELFDRAGGAGIESLLDVGCGEGVLTRRWAEQLPGRHGPVSGGGTGPGLVGQHLREGVQPRVHGVDPGQVGVHDLGRRHLTLGDHGGQLARVQAPELVHRSPRSIET